MKGVGGGGGSWGSFKPGKRVCKEPYIFKDGPYFNELTAAIGKNLNGNLALSSWDTGSDSEST